jgi:hypothetical protein
MASFSEYAGRRRSVRFGRPRSLVAWLILALLVSLPGCGGCNKTPEQIEQEKKLAEEKEKEKEKKKKEEEVKPFEAGMPRVLPTSSLYSGMCKRGHWICQSWPDLKANLGDFQGELQSEVVDTSNRRVPLNDVPYEMTSQRPAALAKKQQKTLESFAWVPSRHDSKLESVNFRLTAPGGGATAIEQSLILKPMPSYQYFFIVLSKGSRFDYLNKRLDSIRLHRLRAESGSESKFYEVVTIAPGKRPGLPSNSLYWTSIAYLLWDESDPTLWDIDQQQAVIDWLHWGGQIIVSGPDALSQLQNSFLRPYLPATVEKSRTFTAEDLETYQYWAGQNGRPPRLVRPWPGAVLKKDPSAESLPNTGNDMVIERRVGHGRIVVTAFRITGSDFSGWEGCDSFFNACLMRRPARKFYRLAPADDLHIDWLAKDEEAETASFRAQKNAANPNADLAAGGDGTTSQATIDNVDPTQTTTPSPAGPQAARPKPGNSVIEAANARQSFLDAKKCTSLRYFSRDAGQQRENYAADVASARVVGFDDSRNPVYGNGIGYMNPGATGNDDDEFDPPEPDKTTAGVGAWSDFSPAAQAAREGLDNATGITVPDRGFIVWMVVGYICVLVPLNWLLFRIIGRVEWAWIAAPLIAIGCTVAVVRQAQLNIGFARSRNEIAVVETQPGYPRAHKTYYTALYSSLASTYELQLADPGGQILPFPTRQNRQHSFGETNSEVVCRRGDDTRLSGFHIASNSKDYVHSEEMSDFGGVVSMHRDSDGGLRITNGTKHPLDNCHVIQIAEQGGRSRQFTVGRLDPGTTTRLKDAAAFDRKKAAEVAVSKVFKVYEGQYRRSLAQYDPAAIAENPGEKPLDPTGDLSAESVAQVALGLQEMRPGEVCLIARIVDEVPGLTVTPETRQFRQAAILIAHLDPGKLPEPERDERSLSMSPSNTAPLPDAPQSEIPDLDPSTP